MYKDGKTQHKRRKGGEVGGKKRDKSIVTSSKFTGANAGHARQSHKKWGVHAQTYQCMRNYPVKEKCGRAHLFFFFVCVCQYAAKCVF